MKTRPQDIQLAGIKHAKEAIAELLNEQSEMAAERDRLKAENAELRAALERIITEAQREDTNPADSCNRITDRALLALAKARHD